MTTTLTKESNVFTVTPVGRFTTDAATDFLKALDPLTQERGVSVVLELSGLEFISSAGLRCFVMLLKTCQANGSSLVLRHPAPQIVDILSLTALLDKFVVE